MADLTTIKTVSDNVFAVKLELVFNRAELDLMDAFGEPTVAAGGDFTGPPAYQLSTNNKRIKTQFPITQSFDGDTDANAEAKADVWATEMATRLTTVMTTLRALSDTFTSENTVSI